MAKPRDLRAELLKVLLWEELKKGDVFEADVRDKQFHIDGLCDGSKVYVNPAPSVVESLLHELLHRAQPHLSERQVLTDSRRVLSRLSEIEVRKWYRKFQRVARKRATPLRADDE